VHALFSSGVIIPVWRSEATGNFSLDSRRPLLPYIQPWYRTASSTLQTFTFGAAFILGRLPGYTVCPEEVAINHKPKAEGGLNSSPRLFSFVHHTGRGKDFSGPFSWLSHYRRQEK
jgi:hypothetical protein